MELLIVMIIALAMDITLGELPANAHPVVWMGRCIEILKNPLLEIESRISGVIITLFTVTVFACLFYLILILFSFNQILYILMASLLLSTTFALKSLLKSVETVKVNLEEDIEKGRQSISLLVSRDTSKLSEGEIVSAAIESLTENITDSVISPLFYTVLMGIMGIFAAIVIFGGSPEITAQISLILGLTGAVAYRVVNTLDAMVGYKDEKNRVIGWFPARSDDYLNYLPARLTGLLMVISIIPLGLDKKNAWRVMKRDASKTPSPNSGYPMAAAAGALQIQLVKPGVYLLGDPINSLKPDKISEAILIAKITITFFLILTLLTLALLPDVIY
jgi:adenosylcobinamide-phosphate synthase